MTTPVRHAAAGEYASVATSRFDHDLAFAYHQYLRFLAIDIFTMFHSLDGYDRVPVVRRPDQYRVNILTMDNMAKVAIRRGVGGIIAI